MECSRLHLSGGWIFVEVKNLSERYQWVSITLLAFNEKNEFVGKLTTPEEEVRISEAPHRHVNAGTVLCEDSVAVLFCVMGTLHLWRVDKGTFQALEKKKVVLDQVNAVECFNLLEPKDCNLALFNTLALSPRVRTEVGIIDKKSGEFLPKRIALDSNYALWCATERSALLRMTSYSTNMYSLFDLESGRKVRDIVLDGTGAMSGAPNLVTVSNEEGIAEDFLVWPQKNLSGANVYSVARGTESELDSSLRPTGKCIKKYNLIAIFFKKRPPALRRPQAIKWQQDRGVLDHVRPHPLPLRD